MSEETTIIAIAKHTQELLKVLETSLDGNLKRGIGKEPESGLSPQNPSIVDEIIDLMRRNNEKLAELSEQIRLNIIIKLDRQDRPESSAR